MKHFVTVRKSLSLRGYFPVISHQAIPEGTPSPGPPPLPFLSLSFFKYKRTGGIQMITKHEESPIIHGSPWQQHKTACAHHGNRAGEGIRRRWGAGAGPGLRLFEGIRARRQQQQQHRRVVHSRHKRRHVTSMTDPLYRRP